MAWIILINNESSWFYFIYKTKKFKKKNYNNGLKESRFLKAYMIPKKELKKKLKALVIFIILYKTKLLSNGCTYELR